MKKKLLSLLLAVALIVSMIPAGIVSAVSTESTAVLTVEKPWSNPGGTVDVNLVISENPGILGATLVVSWDKNLTLVEDASGEAFSHMTYTSPSRYTAAGTNFVWFGNEVGEAVDGTILTLTFQVSKTAENNDILPISVAYTPGDVIDGNDNDVTLSITDGYVRSITYTPGDVTGDGRVNSRDLVRLSQYISDGNKTDPEGYNAEVVADACDVTGDGRVNARDLIRLSQYISDGSQTDPEGYNAVLNAAKLPDCSHADLTATASQAATCTESGNIAYWFCADCVKYFSDAAATTEIAFADTVISETGHTEVVDQAVEPSCTKTGLTEGKHCSVCNVVLVSQIEIGTTNHTPGAQATCTENQICSVCGEVLDTANGHIPGAEATCTVPQTCTVCQTILAEVTKHSLIYTAEKDPVDNNDPGNCAYWQCSVCNNCYLDEDATQEITLADTAWKLFKVTYFCDENNSKQTQWYKVGEEVEELPTPQINGYRFNYWKDGDGKRVSSIPSENTKNLELYAAVELEEYTIYLGGTWKYDNLTYTIQQKVDLPIPIEDGLTFAGWRDADDKVEEYTDSVGVRRWRVPKGTTGDIELIAQWKDNRNLIVPDTRDASDRYVDSGYDETEGYYWFLYSLGEIQNVVLDSERDLVKTKHDGGHIEGSLSLAESTTIEKSVAESVSKTVSHTVTNSTDWSITDSWENSASSGVDVSVMVGAEVGPEFAKAKVEASVGASYETSASVGGSSTDGGGNEESDETSDTIETSFAYNTSFSQAKERTKSFNHDVAPGNYYFANVGTAKVYAFVVFDPVANTFGLETISTLEPETTTAVLSDRKESRNYVSDALSYTVDIDRINNTVNSNFFVQYKSNNSETKSIVKAYPRDTDVQLPDNLFSHPGYTFKHWTTVDGIDYDAGTTVKNLAGPGQLIVLNAQWEANAYTIAYNANGGSGTTTQSWYRYGTPGTLSKNGFTRTGYTFLGWSENRKATEPTYVDEQQINNLGTKTLYAVWKANTYTITYNVNGGTGSTYEDTNGATYDADYIISENKWFSKTNYAFIGWALDPSATTADFKPGDVVSYTFTQGYTLYAVWTPTTGYWNSGLREHTIPTYGFTEYWISGLDRAALQAAGYTKVQIELAIDGKFKGGDWFKADWYFDVYDRWDNAIHQEKHGHFNTSYETWKYTFTISIDAIRDDGTIKIRYDHEGDGADDWLLGTVVINTTAKK